MRKKKDPGGSKTYGSGTLPEKLPTYLEVKGEETRSRG
jgi:hypothetical protein